MSDKPPEPFTLRRWSQRKLAAAREDRPEESAATAGTQSQAAAAPVTPSSAPLSTPAPAAAELPPIESLTRDSDFSVFMRPDVDETLKRGALKKLFSDPHFNIMDGLDTYIDDYSKPDPIAPELVAQLVAMQRVLSPQRTRINAQGYAEDVPPGSPEAVASTAPPSSDGPIGGDEKGAALPSAAGNEKGLPETMSDTCGGNAGNDRIEGGEKKDSAMHGVETSAPGQVESPNSLLASGGEGKP